MACRHDFIIGMTIDEAKEYLASWSNYTLRYHEEGEFNIVTADYVTNRLNVTTKDGVIILIEGFG